MVSILGISGSLRAQSFNTALLRAAQALVADTVQLDIATLHGIPLYDGDDERTHGVPEAVRALRTRMLAADGLLLATPEYNNGIPGVFKNAVDWLSRAIPGEPDVFRDRPLALCGASPGGFGTTLAQSHWLPVLRMLGVRFWSGGRLMVPRAAAVFAADGGLQDDNQRRQLAEFVQGFATFATPRAARGGDGRSPP
jgi:chromate reductase, NAD(P)H dehydrogenase (quinone)